MQAGAFSNIQPTNFRESESVILDRLQETLENVVYQEKMAREKLMEDDGTRLVDKISRAMGSLKNCYLIQSSEAMDHLSLIRLATEFWIPSRKVSCPCRPYVY